MLKIEKIIFMILFLFGCAVIPVKKALADVYQNQEQGYQLWLPAGIQVNFEKKNELEWSAQNRMPFDYVNFRPKGLDQGDAEYFELGVGVHWNQDKLTSRAFADLKDEGVKQSVKQYVTVRSSEITVAGIKGVRDDFALEKEFGWVSYSRVIIPYQNNFFVFLGTLGHDKPVPENERKFQQIIDKFQITQRRHDGAAE